MFSSPFLACHHRIRGYSISRSQVISASLPDGMRFRVLVKSFPTEHDRVLGISPIVDQDDSFRVFASGFDIDGGMEQASHFTVCASTLCG
jgi:hypothetical protein